MIDMKALHRWSQGKPDSSVEVNKRWVREIANLLDRLSVYRAEPYDTSAIRMLSKGDGRVRVSRSWLAHVHHEIDILQKHATNGEPTVRHSYARDRHFVGDFCDDFGEDDLGVECFLSKLFGHSFYGRW